jgi:hypothetical protein
MKTRSNRASRTRTPPARTKKLDGSTFVTDTSIAIKNRRPNNRFERNLVPASSTGWLDPDTEVTLDDCDIRGWDQFANAPATTWDFEGYSTKLSDKRFSAEQLAKADEAAREIEGEVATNPHVGEERGQVYEKMEGDTSEEAKYSMVLGVHADGAPPADPPAAAGTMPAQSDSSALSKSESTAFGTSDFKGEQPLVRHAELGKSGVHAGADGADAAVRSPQAPLSPPHDGARVLTLMPISCPPPRCARACHGCSHRATSHDSHSAY